MSENFGNTESGFVGEFGSVQEVPVGTYADLPDKPSINSVTLEGNKTSSQLGLMDAPSGTPSAYNHMRYINDQWQASKGIKFATITLTEDYNGIDSVILEPGFTRTVASFDRIFYNGGFYAELRSVRAQSASGYIRLGNIYPVSQVNAKLGFSIILYNATLNKRMRVDIGIDVNTASRDIYFISDIDIPTKLSDLTNDEGFIDNTVNDLANYYLKSETYTKNEVNSLIGAITTLDIRVVQVLPTEDISTTTIYLVPSASAGTGNVYDEYIYVNQNWEMIGTTAVDLSNYYTKSEVYNKTEINSMLIMDISNTIFGGE